MAWRPAYQPQARQTTWGNLAEPQRGQRLREGTSSVQAAARRLRVLALEVFFFGTGMTSFLARVQTARSGGHERWSLSARLALGDPTGDPTGDRTDSPVGNPTREPLGLIGLIGLLSRPA